MTDTTAARPAAGLRCSSWTREQGLDPIGSAGSYSGYLLLELPLPWPVDIAGIPGLAPVVAAARQAGVRLQAVQAPRMLGDGSGGGEGAQAGQAVRVASYHRGSGGTTLCAGEEPYQVLHKRERVVEAGDLVATALELLAEAVRDVPAPRATSGAGQERELLICTHGRRDRCCGSLGTTLVAALTARPELLGPSVRVSRTSHTGGHRYAPTAILLPEGTSWAYLDLPSLAAIVNRTGDPAACGPHYRGCAPLGPPAVQALERAVLTGPAELGGPGWDLLGLARSGRAAADGTVELEVEPGSHHPVVFAGRVSVRRRVPVPDCGLPVESARKSENELEVTDLRRLS